jgi:hypothetical protein
MMMRSISTLAALASLTVLLYAEPVGAQQAAASRSGSIQQDFTQLIALAARLRSLLPAIPVEDKASQRMADHEYEKPR